MTNPSSAALESVLHPPDINFNDGKVEHDPDVDFLRGSAWSRNRDRHPRRVGDLISLSNDGKGCTTDRRQGRESLSEYSSSCMDMRANEVLISAEEWDLIARRVGNAREVRSGCRAEPCPPARAAPGRGLCLAVLFLPPNRRSVWITGRRAGRSRGALRARQCGLCPPFRPVSSWVPAAPRTGRSRQCDGRRVKSLSPIRVMAMPVSWDITVERAADSSLQRQP
jgi:hypothetical protein